MKEVELIMSKLKGKVAMVTGAASKRGMGHAIALRLAREGADVIVTDKFANPKSMFPGDENWGGLDEIVKEVEALGCKGMAATMDISVNKDVEAVVTNTMKQFGKIDIMVHAAAIRGPVGVPLIDFTDEDIKTVIDVDLFGTIYVCRAVAREMVARGEGGKIVVIGSVAGIKGVPGDSIYGAAKAGTVSLTKSLALELAKYHINVNGINPAMFVTNLRDDTFAKAAKAEGISWEEARKRNQEPLAKMIPWGRLGKPEEIADLAHFLVSDQAEYLTGEVLILGGGVT
jgi:NAD(P)-dependent dehydrogenase (short-subunit alcohol dehydrogenase family)